MSIVRSVCIVVILGALIMLVVDMDFLSSGFGNVSLFPSDNVDFIDASIPLTYHAPVANLSFFFISQAPKSVEGSVSFFNCTEDECEVPWKHKAYVTIPITYGKAEYSDNASGKKLYTHTPYEVYFHGTGNFYDDSLGMFELQKEEFKHFDVFGVGTFRDMLDETKAINNQTTNDLFNKNTEIGCYGGCADGETIFYNKSNGDRTVSIDVHLGCSGYGCICKDAVLYYNFSFPCPEGNEVSNISLELIRGIDLSIPSEVSSYFKSRSKIHLGNIPSGSVSVYRMTFTFREYALDENDPFRIMVDDMHGHQDIFLGEKAKTKHISIGVIE